MDFPLDLSSVFFLAVICHGNLFQTKKGRATHALPHDYKRIHLDMILLECVFHGEVAISPGGVLYLQGKAACFGLKYDFILFFYGQ